MSEQSSTSWHDVSERVESLAGRLKDQVGQSADKEEVRAALNDLRGAVDAAFKSAGDALKDEAVRSDVKEVGRLLGDAISTSFARVGTEVQHLFDRRPAPPEGETTEPAPSAAGATDGNAESNDGEAKPTPS